jgi:hypothetical protein
MGKTQSTIHDFVDYETVGHYVIREHKTDPLEAMAMSMRSGARRKFHGETCLADARRWASDRYWNEGVL